MKNQDCLFTIWRKRKAEEDMTRNEKKRFDIIEAARLVFMENGFEQTSMDEIAKRAGVSKRTVYGNFGSKEELFAGLMREVCTAKRESVQLEINLDLPLEEALVDLGNRFLEMIFEPEGMILFRIMAGTANTFPEVGRGFYRNGPEDLINYIADYLKSQSDKGVLHIEDPVISAQILLVSMYGAEQMRCLISDAPPPDAAKRDKMVRIAVETFLNGTKAS